MLSSVERSNKKKEVLLYKNNQQIISRIDSQFFDISFSLFQLFVYNTINIKLILASHQKSLYFSRNWPRLLYSKGRSTGGRWEHGAWPRNLPRRLPFFPSNQTTNPGYSPFFPLFHHSRLCGGAECIYLCQTSSSTTKNVFKKLHHQNLRGSQTLVLE